MTKTFQSKTGVTSHMITLMAWGTPITLPPGTRVHLVVGADGVKGDLWAVSDVKLLQELTGNAHDPKYRYLWIDAAAVKVTQPARAGALPC